MYNNYNSVKKAQKNILNHSDLILILALSFVKDRFLNINANQEVI